MSNPAPRRMAAAVIAAPQTLRIDDVPLPEPAHDQVRVEVEGCGVCASNIPPWEGREWFSYPMPPGQLGHEGWGRVEAAGPGVMDLREGDRVAFLSNNAYAEFDVADTDQVVRLPKALDDQPLPGEPLGCAMNIINICGIQTGDTVALVGAGFLGQLLIHLAKQKGARVIALSRRQSALDTARQQGADVVIPMDDHWRIIEQVKERTGGTFCDCVIEATGKEWPLNLAGELTRVHGRLIVAGFHQDGMRQVNMQLWNWRGLTVLNAHWRDPADYIQGIRMAVDAVASGALDPQPLFTHRYALADLDQALNDTITRPEGFMKGLMICSTA
jgi:threonine dehydrogenase-like Zn-dependent dehydrogenase